MVSIEARVDGIIDVGIIVLSHCENPANEEALSFLTKILKKEIVCIIPYSVFLGAYHVLTRYLNTNREETATRLINTAMISRDIFHSEINHIDIKAALDKAYELNIEAWDGYLFSLMSRYKTKVIYSIDRKLKKACTIINPISEETMVLYHDWLRKRITVDEGSPRRGG